jgi:hypothetical protein
MIPTYTYSYENTANGAYGWSLHENKLARNWQWSAFGPNAGNAGQAKTKDDARLAAFQSMHVLKGESPSSRQDTHD